VRLELDWQRKDRYGRTLAYVFLADGRLLNAEIIRQGYGHAYTKYPFQRLEEFRQIQREARQAGRDVWAEAPPRLPSARVLAAVPSGSACGTCARPRRPGSKVYSCCTDLQLTLPMCPI
jgi:endonuclease YncB( thermonuclease family)